MKHSLNIAIGLVALFIGLTSTWLVHALSTNTVNLGTLQNFAVISSSSITSNGSTIITGDVGISPGTIITGFPTGTIFGSQRIGGVIADQAKIDLNNVYADINSRVNPTNLSGDIGGQVLTPGLFRSNGSLGITGIVTLDWQGDPNAIFVIQSVDNLNVTAGSRIQLTGWAQACNVFWQSTNGIAVGSNASMQWNFIAAGSVSLANGALVNGRVLSRNGGVFLDANIITMPTCNSSNLTGNVRIITRTINDSGGTQTPANFVVRLRNALNTEVSNSPSFGAEWAGTLYTLSGGTTYAISVDSKMGYLGAQLSGDCSNTGSITIPVGSNLICNITIDDSPTSDLCPAGDFSQSPNDGHCFSPVVSITAKGIPEYLPYEGGSLTYVYTVKNPGRIALSNIGIGDTNCSNILPLRGDANENGLLDTNETWTYKCSAFVYATTTSKVTVNASGDGLTATASVFPLVIVADTPTPGLPIVVIPTFPNTGFDPYQSNVMSLFWKLWTGE